MSWKSILVIALIVAAAIWYVMIGPEGCELLNDTKYRGVKDDLFAWVGENINSTWLEDRPSVSSIKVEKVRMKKFSPTDEQYVETGEIVISGYYILKANEQQVRFKITKQIRINRYRSPISFKLLD